VLIYDSSIVNQFINSQLSLSTTSRSLFLMNSRAIWGTVLAVVFALSMIMVPAFAGGHVFFKDVELTKNGNHLEISVNAKIPQDGSGGNFGYAAFGSKAALAITSHGPLGNDSKAQKFAGDPVFHTHALQVTAGCTTGVEVVSASFNEVAKIIVDDDTVVVKGISGKIGKLTGTVDSFFLSSEGPKTCVTFIDTKTSE